MDLHKNNELFIKIIDEIADEKNYDEAVIEKDYYVTLFLREMTKKLPNLIFKGGTSLSKCYKIIKRFSEDIDIAIDFDGEKPTIGQRKNIKKSIKEICEHFGFEILNLENTRSSRDFNHYEIAYPTEFALAELRQYLLIESSVAVKSFPTEVKPAKSIIQEYLEEKGLQNVCEKYGLKEFEVRVQTLERTLVDKIFALGDYYLTKRELGHSRHIYDIYKLLPFVTINKNFKNLVKEVRILRQGNKYCYSTAEGQNMQTLLDEIIKKDTYKKDYETNLSFLLFEKISYSQAKEALIEIFNKNIFNN
jgi:predicted nucleotidyltransferase component of viral defense system